MTFIGEKLQNAYNNSSPAEVVVDSTNGPVTVKDNSTPTEDDILKITDNAGSNEYLTVDNKRTKINGYIKNDAISTLSTIVASKWIADGTIDDNDWNDIEWSPELKRFVAVAGNGTNRIFYSDDGITWTTPTTIPANSASNWRRVRWGAGTANKFVIIGTTDTNRMLTSVDGDTWITVTLPGEVTTQDWYSMARSEELDRFVVLPNSGTTTGIYSSDGISWTTMTTTGATFWYDVDWSPKLNLFAAINGTLTDRIMTSSDGITWATKTASDQVSWFTLKWSPCLELFLAGATDGKIMKSSNGDNDWTTVIDTAENFRNCVSMDELNIFMFCSATNQFVYSTNGDIWETTDQPNTGSFFAIEWSPYLGRAVALTTDGGITTPFRTVKDVNLDYSSPSGNDKAIQYNNNGILAADDELTWDTTDKRFKVNGILEQGFNDTYTILEQFSDVEIDGTVDIMVKHGLAFLLCRDSDKLVIVDIKDPSSMSVVNTYTLAGFMDYPCYFDFYGEYIIIGNGSTPDNIMVLDVSDVLNITLVKTFKDDDYFENSLTGMKVYKNHLYIATSGTNDSIVVMDITDINRMYVVSSFTDAAMVDPGGPFDISDNYMYLFSEGNGSNNFLIIDISDPSNLSLAGSLNDSEFRTNYGIVYRDNYVYCCSSVNNGATEHFHIIDVSDKTTPAKVGTLQRNDIRTSRFVLTGNYVFILAGTGSPILCRIDVSDPVNPTLFAYSTGLGSSSGITQSLIMYKNVIYAAHSSSNDYLTSIDVGGTKINALTSGITYTDELYVSGETSFKKGFKFENFLTNGSTMLNGTSISTLDITAQQNLKTNNKIILGDNDSSKELIIKGNDGHISLNSDTVIMGNLMNPVLKLANPPTVDTWSSYTRAGTWNAMLWNEEHDFLLTFGYNSGSSNGYYSINDGASWINFSPGDNTQAIKDAVWIPRHNITVAIAGDGGSTSNAQRIFYSKYIVTPSNGWNDYAYPLGGTPDFSAIEWSPELDVIIATLTTGQVSITTNVEVNHWVEYTLAETGTNLNDIVWSSEAGMFVTVASTGTNRIQTSPDGKTWTSYNVGAHSYTCITWAPQIGLFVACSNPITAVATSPDGVNWTVVTSNLPANNIDCIAWSKDKFLFAAAGTSANIYLSPDGINWVEESTTNANFKSIIWAGGPISRFFSCSSDGNIERTDVVSASGTYNITFPKSQGTNGNILVNDGTGTLSWGIPTLNLQNVYDNSTLAEIDLNSTQKGLIIKDNSTPIDEPLFHVTDDLGAKDNIRVDATQVIIDNELDVTGDIIMKDFKRYNQITTIGSFSNATHPQTEQWGSVVWAGHPINKFVAVNWSSDATNSFTYSDDGLTWTTAADSEVSSVLDVIWVKELGKIFAVGSGNDISYSSTGTSWTNTSVTGAGSSYWESIAWAAEISTLVVVGRSGSDQHVASSTDGGITWTERTATTTNQSWYGVAWSGKLNLFVAVGGGSTDKIMFSSDGETWDNSGITANSNSWDDVAWSDELEMFVAVASNNVAYSYDGKTWTDTSFSGRSYFVEWIRELGVFIAARSNLDRVHLSPDGVTWTEYTSKLPNSNWWRSAAWSQPLGRLILGSSTSSTNSMAYIDIADNTNNLRFPLAEGSEGQVMKKTSTRGALEWEDANQLPSHTVAGVPSASPAGRIIYVSDETGGAVLAFSDGTNWRRSTDRTIVS